MSKSYSRAQLEKVLPSYLQNKFPDNYSTYSQFNKAEMEAFYNVAQTRMNAGKEDLELSLAHAYETAQNQYQARLHAATSNINDMGALDKLQLQGQMHDVIASGTHGPSANAEYVGHVTNNMMHSLNEYYSEASPRAREQFTQALGSEDWRKGLGDLDASGSSYAREFKAVPTRTAYGDDGEEYETAAETGQVSPSAVFASKLGKEGRVIASYLEQGLPEKFSGQGDLYEAAYGRMREQQDLFKHLPTNVSEDQFNDALAMVGNEGVNTVLQQVAAHTKERVPDILPLSENSPEMMQKIFQGHLDNAREGYRDLLSLGVKPPKNFGTPHVESFLKSVAQNEYNRKNDFAIRGIQGSRYESLQASLQRYGFSNIPASLGKWDKSLGVPYEEYQAQRGMMKGFVDSTFGLITEGGDTEQKYAAFSKAVGSNFSSINDEIQGLQSGFEVPYMFDDADHQTALTLGLDSADELKAVKELADTTGQSVADLIDEHLQDPTTSQVSETAADMGASRNLANPKAITREKGEVAETPVKPVPHKTPVGTSEPTIKSVKPIIQPPKGEAAATVKSAAANGASQEAMQQQAAMGAKTAADDKAARSALRMAGLTVHDVEQRSDEWHQLRQDSPLTGTAAKKIVQGGDEGIHGWIADSLNLDRSKTVNSSAMNRGNKDEDFIEDYFRKYLKGQDPNLRLGNVGFITSQREEFKGMGYSPDGIVTKAGRLEGLSEYKSVSQLTYGFDQNSGEMTDKFRKKYNDQIQMGMALTGAEQTWHTQYKKAQKPWEVDEYETNLVKRDPQWLEDNKERFAEAKDTMAIHRYKKMASDEHAGIEVAPEKKEEITKAYEDAMLRAEAKMAEDTTGKFDRTKGLKDFFKKMFGKDDEGDDDGSKKSDKGGKGGGGGGGAGPLDWMSAATGGADSLLAMGAKNPFIKAIMVGKQVYDTALEGESGYREAIGEGLDHGYENPLAYRASKYSMEAYGLSEKQAQRFTDTVSDTAAQMSVGEASGMKKIVVGTRGLITPQDIWLHGNDPTKLADLFRERAKQSGLSQRQIAGMAQLSGLDLGRLPHSAEGASDYAAERVAHAESYGTAPAEAMGDLALTATRANYMKNQASDDVIGIGGPMVAAGLNEAMSGLTSAIEALTAAIDVDHEAVEGFSSSVKGGESIWAAAAKENIKKGGMLSVAERHNNPGNLVFANQQGASKGETINGHTFAQFDTEEEGILALERQLRLDHSRGKNTLSSIMNKYAPPSSNNTAAYIDFLVKQTGYGANQKLDFNDPEVVAKLMQGISSHEGGKGGLGIEKMFKTITGQGSPFQRNDVSSILNDIMDDKSLANKGFGAASKSQMQFAKTNLGASEQDLAIYQSVMKNFGGVGNMMQKAQAENPNVNLDVSVQVDMASNTATVSVKDGNRTVSSKEIAINNQVYRKTNK